MTRSAADRAKDCFERLKGPIVPLNLCFDDKGEVDIAAIRRYVDWLCRERVPVILLTYISSYFMWLTRDVHRRLTAALAEEIAGRALFISSTLWEAPAECRDFIQFADRVGVDIVKVQTNPWFRFPPHQQVRTIRGYFDAIVDASDMPLLLWSARESVYPVELVAELADRKNIIGVKNDGEQFDYYYDLLRATEHKQFAVVSGGFMRNFFFGVRAGSPAYLCPIAPFLPSVALTFYDHIANERFDDAWDMVQSYERPWVHKTRELDLRTSMHSVYFLYGLYPSNRVPAPGASHTSDQVEQVRQIIESVFGPIEPVGL